MNEHAATDSLLLRENQELRTRLEEAEAVIGAIRSDEVDALVVSGPLGDRIHFIESAERPYRLLVEQMQEAAVTLTADDIILYSNLRFADMLRMPHEKLVATSIHRVVSSEDSAVVEALLRDGRTGICRAEVRMVAHDGRLVPAHITVAPLLAEGRGQVCLVITDLTEQKRNEEIVASEQLSRSILEHAAEAIIVCDPEGRIIRASQEAHRLAGQNVLLEPFGSVFRLELEDQPALSPASELSEEPEESEALPSPVRAALLGETQRGVEARFHRRGDKQARHVLLTAGALRSAQGDALGCVVTLADITTRKATEQELQRQRMEIATLNERLQRAVKESHHRIKNNLQVLAALMDVQNLKGGETVPASELRRLGQHTRSLASLHDLLTLEARSSVTVDAISLQAVLDRLVPMMEDAAGGRRIRTQAQEAPLSLHQTSAFTLLVNELVSNAIKHGRGDIEISLLLEGNTAQLAVSDEGPGFPPDFDVRSAANTGMELIESLAKWDLQGQISYGNRPQGGACVVVMFPLSTNGSSSGS